MTARSPASKPCLEAPDCDGHIGLWQRQGVGKPRDGFRLRKAVIVEDVAETLARAVRPCADDNAPPCRLQIADVLDDGVEDVRRPPRPARRRNRGPAAPRNPR